MNCYVKSKKELKVILDRSMKYSYSKVKSKKELKGFLVLLALVAIHYDMLNPRRN